MVVFIAIELDDCCKEEICRYVRTGIRPTCRGGRWVDKQNYHLTLKYIGQTREQEIDALYDLLNKAVARTREFVLTTGCVGIFGGSRAGRARVLWLDTQGQTEALRGLREYVEDKAVELGYKPENRFSPHITLARDVFLTRQPYEMDRLQPVNIDVTSVSLMESRVEKGTRVYLPLSVHKFK